MWTPVPWRCVDKKQMLYPLDHNTPLQNFGLPNQNKLNIH